MDTNLNVRPGTVIVGYDGSDHSEYALRWAADEADLDGKALTIVSVVSPLGSYELSALAGGWMPPAEVRDAILKNVGDKLDAAKAALHQSMPDLEVDVALREGDARQVLIDLSKDAASLFVGSRGRGAVKSLLLGSVSVAVARASECPVFVIRPSRPAHERHGILVGTDCGEHTRPTLEFAYRQAALRGLPLTVLHCVDGVEIMYGGGVVIGDDVAGYDDERRELAEALAGMAEKFPEVEVRPRIGQGLADVVIVQESERMDLVVVGHHQGRHFGDMLRIGSFVAPIVESSACPVAIAVDRPSSDRQSGDL